MNFFSHLNVGQKIALALTVPIIGMAFFAFLVVQEEQSQTAELGALETLTELSVVMSNLVHEQQKERGATAGFLNSKGNKFRDTLAKQRQETDDRKQTLLTYLDTFNSARFGADFETQLDAVQTTLQRMDTARRQTDSLSIALSDALGYYTGLNGQMLDVIAVSARLSGNADITRKLRTYVNFLQSKERAGVERAVGTAAFSAGRFSPTLLNRFKTLITIQDTYINTFLSVATKKQKENYHETLKGKAVEEVARMRTLAIETPNDVSAVDGSYWFATITKKINLLKQIEDSIATGLQEDTRRLKTEAEASKRNHILIALGSLLTALALGWISIRAIVRPVTAVTDILGRLADEDTNVSLPEAGRDEIGRMIQATHQLQHAVEQGVGMQAAIRGTASGIMMADPAGIIIHLNPSCQRLFQEAQDGIREEKADFDVDTLENAPLSTLYTPPSSIDGVHHDEFTLGRCTFTLSIRQVANRHGTPLGMIVEWEDVTALRAQERQEQKVEKEIASIVDACASGDFGRRLNTEDKEGFLRTLAEGINRIGEVSDSGLGTVMEILEGLAEGDLTRRMDGEYGGVFADIQNALNHTITRLRDLVGQVQESAEAVNSATIEIAAGGQDLSHRTESQAATLEETAASMETMTNNVRESGKNAARADELSRGANDIAERGGTVVQEAVSAMHTIEESSQKIADIVSMIDEIAFQTNLLALNAAVEAARAGEAGKGFAVVASEVRALAGRSASASKEIRELIQSSVTEVEQGSQLVTNTGAALSEIVEANRKLAEVIAEIASTSAEQTSSIEEINTAVAQMDDATQQNAALVEESTAAAQSMTQQARTLEELMRFFRIDGGNAGDDAQPYDTAAM